jgi:hypothetical protein
MQEHKEKPLPQFLHAALDEILSAFTPYVLRQPSCIWVPRQHVWSTHIVNRSLEHVDITKRVYGS